MRARTLLVATAMAAGALLMVGGPAIGVPLEYPLDVGGATVVDRADALSASEESDVEAASDRLFAERGDHLVVVVVGAFSGTTDDVDWANETAILSNLSSSDVVLAISVDDQTAYWSVDSDYPLSDEDLNEIRDDDVLPLVRSGDIGGAAIAFADGVSDARAPSPVPWIVGGVVVVGVVAAAAIPPIRRRQAAKRAAADAEAAAGELERRAGTLLIELDDALKSSEQELGFAQAQFGEASTQDFVVALAEAQQTATQAFEIRQKLDDAFPETPDARRALTEQLIALAGQADATLDAQAAKFDELRQLEKNAPRVLEQVAATRAGLADRIAAAETTLAALAGRFPQADLTTIADAPAQARKLDAFAGSVMETARAALSGAAPATSAIGTPSPQGPAVAVRAAQQAVGQAEQLLASVDARGSELVAQEERNASASRELSHELEDARAQIAAVTDYITTHRGAIQTAARTRASEAQRNLDEANAVTTSDPPTALASAKRAESLAIAALGLARTDVDGYQSALSPNGYGYSDATQPSGNPYAYDGSDGAGLGGILGDLFGGGYDDDSSGSSWWGGGSSGGSSGSSSGGGWSWGGSSGGFGGSSRRQSSSGGSRRSSGGGGSRRSSGGGRRR